jgi:hypothetical protein
MGLEVTKERRRFPRWVLALAVLCVAGCAGLVCGGYVLLRLLGEAAPLEGPQPATNAEIEALARITLPPGATNIHAQAGGFQDRYIHVRFDIPAAELDAFLAASRYTPALDMAVVPFQQHLEPKAVWWQPRNAARFRAGSAFSGGISQSLLVDTSDPERYVVYVQTFET